jgi:hypothetical protein
MAVKAFLTEDKPSLLDPPFPSANMFLPLHL